MDCVEVFTFPAIQPEACISACFQIHLNPTYCHACLILDQISRRSEDRENSSTDILKSHINVNFVSTSSHSSDFRGCSRSQQHQQMDGRQPRMDRVEVLTTFWLIHLRLAFLDAFKFTYPNLLPRRPYTWWNYTTHWRPCKLTPRISLKYMLFSVSIEIIHPFHMT